MKPPNHFAKKGLMSAIFTNGYLHNGYRDNPPGSDHGLASQRIKLLL
jgi:hypothetical protein